MKLTTNKIRMLWPARLMQAAFSIDRQVKHRCPKCRWTFGLGSIKPGTSLSVKCPKCKEFFMIGEGNPSRREMRCPNCKKLLAKGDMGAGSSLEPQCPRCGTPVPWTKL